MGRRNGDYDDQIPEPGDITRLSSRRPRRHGLNAAAGVAAVAASLARVNPVGQPLPGERRGLAVREVLADGLVESGAEGDRDGLERGTDAFDVPEEEPSGQATNVLSFETDVCAVARSSASEMVMLISGVTSGVACAGDAT